MENFFFVFFCFSLCFDVVSFVGDTRVWGAPRMQGLCSISAHLWANSDFVLLYLGTPENAGVM